MILFYLKKIIFFITLLFLINGCDKFKRFGQEKYLCSENKFFVSQIDIIKSNSIEKAYVVINNDEVPLKILNNDEKEAVLSIKEFILNINKENNQITISNENKIHFLKCKIETFTM